MDRLGIATSVWWLPSPPLGRAVNILPRGPQAIEKRAEVVAACRRLAMAIAYSGELLLHIPNEFSPGRHAQLPSPSPPPPRSPAAG